MACIELNIENYKEETSEGVVLVDFWASWCGPCRLLNPVINELSDEFEGKAKICKVNSDYQLELSKQQNIKSVPTILFIKNGKVVDTMIGAQPKDLIESKLNELIK